MNKFTQEQLDLMQKLGRNPNNYTLLYETETELVLIHKRGRRFTIKKEIRT